MKIIPLLLVTGAALFLHKKYSSTEPASIYDYAKRKPGALWFPDSKSTEGGHWSAPGDADYYLAQMYAIGEPAVMGKQ